MQGKKSAHRWRGKKGAPSMGAAARREEETRRGRDAQWPLFGQADRGGGWAWQDGWGVVQGRGGRAAREGPCWLRWPGPAARHSVTCGAQGGSSPPSADDAEAGSSSSRTRRCSAGGTKGGLCRQLRSFRPLTAPRSTLAQLPAGTRSCPYRHFAPPPPRLPFTGGGGRLSAVVVAAAAATTPAAATTAAPAAAAAAAAAAPEGPVSANK